MLEENHTWCNVTINIKDKLSNLFIDDCPLMLVKISMCRESLDLSTPNPELLRVHATSPRALNI